MEWIALLVTLFLFALLKGLDKRGVDFGLRILIATALGIGAGIVFKGSTEYVSVFGKVFVNLLKAMVVPLLFFSIITTIASLENVEKLRTIGAKAIGLLSVHNVMASVSTLAIALAFGLGRGNTIPVPTDQQIKEVPSLVDTIVGFFPSNIVEHAASNQVIPVIVFSALLGIAVLTFHEDRETIAPFVNFVKAGNELIFRVIALITELTPYAVLGLIAHAIGRSDLASLAPLLVVLLAVYLAGLFHSFVNTGLLIAIAGKLNPVTFFKKFYPVQTVAFSTQSSVGSIPVNIEYLEEMGVPKRISSFAVSLGANVGMPGCAAIWPVIIAIFTVNAQGLSYGLTDYLLLIAVALVVSLGTVGVPGTATITATAVFAAMNLPVEMIIIMQPISAVADMMRTATNVTAAGSTALIVAQSEGVLDKARYEAPIGSNGVGAPSDALL